MNDLPSLVRAVTAEAYELAAKRGRLPEQIEVKANFDMDDCGRLRLNQSRSFPGLIDVKMQLAPQAAPTGLRLISDYLANESTRGHRKNTRKQVNHAILYRRQGGYCAGCRHYFQPRNLTIDHVVPSAKGGSHDISNLQLLCHACKPVEGRRIAGAVDDQAAGARSSQSGPKCGRGVGLGAGTQPPERVASHMSKAILPTVHHRPTNFPATVRRWCHLSSTFAHSKRLDLLMSLRRQDSHTPQPQFEDGSVYGEKRPTRRLISATKQLEIAVSFSGKNR